MILVTSKENNIRNSSIRVDSMSANAYSVMERQNMKLFDKDQINNRSTKFNVIRTVNDLQKNVLYYGLSRKEVKCSNKSTTQPWFLNLNLFSKKLPNIQTLNSKHLTESDPSTNEAKVFSLMNLSNKNLIVRKPDETSEKPVHKQVSTDVDLKRMHRGFSARRYLRNLTKNWDQSLLDAFINDGKLCQETIYRKNEKTQKIQRVQDDLTALPQAYKFEANWNMATFDMKTYKFLRARNANEHKRLKGLLNVDLR